MNIDNVCKFEFEKFDVSLLKSYTKEELKDKYRFLCSLNSELKSICKLNTRFFSSSDIEIIDDSDFEDKMKDYYPLKHEYETLLNKWKNENPDYFSEFIVLERITPTKESKDMAIEFIKKYLITDDDKMFYYIKTKNDIEKFKEYLKESGNFNCIRKVIKDEYKVLYENIKSKLQDSTGWMGEQYYKSHMDIKKIPSKKYNQNRVIKLEISNSLMEIKDDYK